MNTVFKISVNKKRNFQDLLKTLFFLSSLFLDPFTVPGGSVCSDEQFSRTRLLVRGQTVENLLSAYRGETTACAKYASFAWKAKNEGFNEIALLFSAISNSEHIHARQHKVVLMAMGFSIPDIQPRFIVKSTHENLKNAISGELGEITITYPEFMAVANKERNQKALESFNHAYKAEIKHKAFFEEAQAALMTGNLKKLPLIYSVCQICGNTYNTQPPVRCAICTSPAEKFLKVIRW